MAGRPRAKAACRTLTSGKRAMICIVSGAIWLSRMCQLCAASIHARDCGSDSVVGFGNTGFTARDVLRFARSLFFLGADLDFRTIVVFVGGH